MPRRAAPARLADVDPLEIAREVTARVAADYARAAVAMGAGRPSPTPEPPVYQRACALAAYAAWGEPLPRGREVSAELEWLARLLHLRALPRGEPRTLLEAVLLGARARDALAKREPLSAAQVAILCDVDRDHVLARAPTLLPGAYRESEQPRAAWRFPVSAELERWLVKREARYVA